MSIWGRKNRVHGRAPQPSPIIVHVPRLSLTSIVRVAFIATLLILASAQNGFSQTTMIQPPAELPEDPGASLQGNGASAARNDGFSGSISGIALDVNGGIVPGAKITLTQQGPDTSMKTIAAADGSFTFSSLSPGVYRVTVEAEGLQTYQSSEITLQQGQTLQAPTIGLRLSETITSIDVTATQEEVAAAQVSQQVKQRVFGVFPNFYTSYIWNAAPMTSKQKFGLALRTTIDPVNILTIAGVAGAEQVHHSFPAYDGGIGGYGKRYTTRFSDVFFSRMIGSAILPSLFHQDPRYFYRGSGSTASRVLYAMSSAVIARGDDGRRQPNYSHLLGNLAAGGIANVYRPPSDRGVALTFETALVEAGVDAVGNVVREFLLRRVTPSVPDFAEGNKK